MNQTHFTETESLVLLNRLVCGGGRQVLDLLDQGVTAFQIVTQILEENLFRRKEALLELLTEFSPAKELDDASRLGIRVLSRSDDEYPELLKKIYDPPVILYMRGSLTELDRAAVSIVGSRSASFYGLDQSRTFARELSAQGITVVSGLARGIDRAAHEGALQCAYGRTIAVLGCGADIIYPRENARLFSAIIERGAVLSELPLGSGPLRYHFPRRNRIIAGLSLGTLIVQANERSGSLITARLALEEGREVFALPGPVNDPLSKGALGLVREGASLVMAADDIMHELEPHLREISGLMPVRSAGRTEIEDPGRVHPDSPAENGRHHNLLDVLSKMPLTLGELSEQSGIQLSSLTGSLLELELQKQVIRTRDGRYRTAG